MPVHVRDPGSKKGPKVMTPAGRVHRAVSADGTEIAGHVEGEGPPLVLVHGGLSDGDLNWIALLPFLTERFTCHLMSTRGRGLSADHPDHSPARLVEDVTAFVDSIGEPVGLVGHSSGAIHALGAAAHTAAVSALAVYEPAVLSVLDEEEAARIEGTFARMGEVAGEGRLADAASIFYEAISNEEELPALSASDYIETRVGYVPVILDEVQQGAQYAGPRPSDPSMLERITVPVLLLYGARTGAWFADSVRYVADHVSDSGVRAIAGAGHFGPALAPDVVADELTRFFGTASSDTTP